MSVSRTPPFRLVLALMALLLSGQVLTASPASAHDYLVSSSPRDGATADPAPSQVTLTFSEEVKTRFSTVRVTGPSGTAWQDGPPEVRGTSVTQRLRALGPAGPYRVTWRVVSADGHPISGTFSFRLGTASSGSATAEPTSSTEGPAEGPQQRTAEGPAAGAGGSAPEEPAGSNDWVPLAVGLGAVALVLAGAGAALARRRTSAADAGADAGRQPGRRGPA